MGYLDEPFPGSWAVASGEVTRWELARNCTRVFPDVYLRTGVELDARGRAIAAGHWAKGACVLVGYSAAAMVGTKWVDADRPAEVARPAHIRGPKGIHVRRDAFARDETCEISGFQVTTPARTAFDLGRRIDGDDAVIAIDALCNATGLDPKEVFDLAERHPGARGIAGLRRTLCRVDGGAESPRETRTRLLLLDDGLPPPETQIRIRDHSGMVVARADMGWPQWKVIVEYDGEQHWTDPRQRAWDIERTELLHALGWRIVRVGARTSAHRVVDRVRSALLAAGAPI